MVRLNLSSAFLMRKGREDTPTKIICFFTPSNFGQEIGTRQAISRDIAALLLLTPCHSPAFALLLLPVGFLWICLAACCTACFCLRFMAFARPQAAIEQLQIAAYLPE